MNQWMKLSSIIWFCPCWTQQSFCLECPPGRSGVGGGGCQKLSSHTVHHLPPGQPIQNSDTLAGFQSMEGSQRAFSMEFNRIELRSKYNNKICRIQIHSEHWSSNFSSLLIKTWRTTDVPYGPESTRFSRHLLSWPHPFIPLLFPPAVTQVTRMKKHRRIHIFLKNTVVTCRAPEPAGMVHLSAVSSQHSVAAHSPRTSCPGCTVSVVQQPGSSAQTLSRTTGRVVTSRWSSLKVGQVSAVFSRLTSSLWPW